MLTVYACRSGCTARRSPIALRTADRLRSSGLTLRRERAMELRRVELGAFGNRAYTAESLRRLTKRNQQISLLAFLEDAVQVLGRKGVVFAKQLGHCVVMRSIFHSGLHWQSCQFLTARAISPSCDRLSPPHSKRTICVPVCA